MGERGRLAASPWSPSCPRASLPLRPGRLSRVPGSGAAGPPGRVPDLWPASVRLSLSPRQPLWGERGKAGRPGQGRGTATATHPPTPPAESTTRTRPAPGESRQKRDKGRQATPPARDTRSKPGASPGTHGSPDHPRAGRARRRTKEPTHPPGTPAGRRKGPAVRGGTAGREGRRTGAHVRPRGGVGAGW